MERQTPSPSIRSRSTRCHGGSLCPPPTQTKSANPVAANPTPSANLFTLLRLYFLDSGDYRTNIACSMGTHNCPRHRQPTNQSASLVIRSGQWCRHVGGDLLAVYAAFYFLEFET